MSVTARPRGADTVRINSKSGYIFHLARILDDQPEEKVRAVFTFAAAFCLGVRPCTQQNPDFVGYSEGSRKASKCAEFSELPDLITDVLDRGKPL